MKRLIYMLGLAMMMAGVSLAKVDLVTLPERDMVQLTIYNSADLTLARESRDLTVSNGVNKLQFSWENTLIDPTSLEMVPLKDADKLDIFDLTFPPRVRNLGLWTIQSQKSGEVPVEISYLTSGLSWRAFYMGTLSEDEKMMRLNGYVRVTNNSGEDYENAEVRLIVGKVNLLDQIGELARRQHPYGSPGVALGVEIMEEAVQERYAGKKLMRGMGGGMMGGMAPAAEPMLRKREIVKEGLSEYFLYTIEGKDTIPNGWSKRLPSLDVEDIPVVNLYKYDDTRTGNAVFRYLSFKNDEEHEMGETPIPGGLVKVYRGVDVQEHLSYTGQSNMKYVPVGEKVELNLGRVSDVLVEPVDMKFQTLNYRYDSKGNINGWDEIRTVHVKVTNARTIPVTVEIKRHVGFSRMWDIEYTGDYGEYEKVDISSVKYKMTLEAESVREFDYVLTSYFGERIDEVSK